MVTAVDCSELWQKERKNADSRFHPAALGSFDGTTGSHGVLAVRMGGQAWALTHFFMERHFDELMVYYRRLGEIPTDVTLSQVVLKKLFGAAFGEERSHLDIEWRHYMAGLKTDTQRILEEANK